MQENNIYVQKRGEVYTVHVADNGMPLPVATVDDEPVGAFPFTFTSRKELEAHFPGRHFVMLEAKTGVQQVVKYDPEIERQALAILGQKPPSTQPAKKGELRAVAVESQEMLAHHALGPRGRAEEFLKRLQTALQYASKKHAPKLQHQIEAVEELINEVYKS